MPLREGCTILDDYPLPKGVEAAARAFVRDAPAIGVPGYSPARVLSRCVVSVRP